MVDIHQPTLQVTNARCWVTVWLSLVVLGPLALHAHPQATPKGIASGTEPQKRRVFGVVIEQRKYSVRVASGGEDLEVFVPDKTPIDQRLDKPRLDLAGNVVLQELLGSQEQGSGIPVEVQETLPEPLGLMAEFAHLNERKRILGETPKKLVRYRLLPFDLLPSDPENELLLTGKVASVDELGQIVLQTGTDELIVELGNRDGRLGARTIADLRPFETDVEIQADLIDGKWIAQNVLYRRVKWTSKGPDGGPTRILVLGDEVSLSYLHSLRKQLGDAHEVHHPPENCRGSANWDRLPMWLGPYRTPGYQWDVIVFNLGLGDLHTETVAYRNSLRAIVPQLRATGAKLIWLSTTPLPNGWEGTVANTGRKISRNDAITKIRELNQIANQELNATGDIHLLDLGSEIETQLSTRFANWAAGKTPLLNAEQCKLVAEKFEQTLDELLLKRAVR